MTVAQSSSQAIDLLGIQSYRTSGTVRKETLFGRCQEGPVVPLKPRAVGTCWNMLEQQGILVSKLFSQYIILSTTPLGARQAGVILNPMFRPSSPSDQAKHAPNKHDRRTSTILPASKEEGGR